MRYTICIVAAALGLPLAGMAEERPGRIALEMDALSKQTEYFVEKALSYELEVLHLSFMLALSAEICSGTKRFSASRKARAALRSLVDEQSDHLHTIPIDTA